MLDAVYERAGDAGKTFSVAGWDGHVQIAPLRRVEREELQGCGLTGKRGVGRRCVVVVLDENAPVAVDFGGVLAGQCDG